MSNFATILAALDASGVTGLASAQYRPAEDMKDDSRPAFSREFGCLVWAVGGKDHPEVSWPDARDLVSSLLDVPLASLKEAERVNDRDLTLQNTPEACAARLAHVRQWLKEHADG